MQHRGELHHGRAGFLVTSQTFVSTPTVLYVPRACVDSGGRRAVRGHVRGGGVLLSLSGRLRMLL